MSYKPQESDGLNLKALITEMGSDPAPESQGNLFANTVIALYNMWRSVSASIPKSEATITEDTGASRVLALADAQAIIERNSGSANTTTIPLNATVAFPIGTTIDIVQTGAGLSSIIGATGVTINGTAEAGGDESQVDSQGQWKAMSIYKRATDIWVVIGGA